MYNTYIHTHIYIYIARSGFRVQVQHLFIRTKFDR